ncbi:MAG: DUF2512 family protein [Eubacteriales bacterium]
MKHVLALIIKFAIVAAVLEAVLHYLSNLSVLNTLYVALAVTIIAYLIGDLIILPRTNNTIATIADAMIALLTILAFNYIIPNARISFANALITCAVLAVGEWIYHKYVRGAVFPSM